MMGSSVADVQLQIRRNAEEYRAAVDDLAGWQRQMAAKDRQAPAPATTAEPPVRGQQQKQQQQKQQQSQSQSQTPQPQVQQQQKQQPQRLKSSDYRAWDQLDVDCMLNDLDHEPVVAPVAEPAAPPARNPELALVEKDTGNVYFKRGKFTKAAAHYTRALDLDPLPVYRLNRAMALLKLEKYADAEADCDTVLIHEPKNVKALWRRATARRNQGNTTGAVADLERALVLEPTNKALREDLVALQPPPPPKQPPKALTRRRRLEIREVDSASDIRPAVGLRPVETKRITTPTPAPAAPAPEDKAAPPSPAKNVDQITEQSISSTASSSVSPSETKSLVKSSTALRDAASTNNEPSSSQQDQELPISQVQTAPSTDPVPVTEPSVLTSSAPAEAANPQQATPPAISWPTPSFSWEFDRDVKAMRACGQLDADPLPAPCVAYVRSIPPRQLPTLFKLSLDAVQLGALLRLVAGLRPEPKDVYNYLYWTSRCLRFGACVPLLDPAEHALVRTLFAWLAEQFRDNTAALDKVRTVATSYGVPESL